MVDLIQQTGFSIQFVLDKLNTTNGNNSKLNSKLPIGQLECFETKNISEGNAFMSKILRLILHWKDSSIDLPSSIIMKVPSPQHKKLQNMEGDESSNPMDDPELKWLCEFLVGAHRREINFYEHFSRLDPSLRLPKFYFGSDYHPSHRDGLILMEDLTPKGTTIPVLPGLNDAQVLEVLNEMAKIHSTSWRFPKWEKHISTQGGENTFRDLIRGMDDGAKRLAEIDPDFGPLVDRVLPLFTVESCEFVIYSGSKFGFPASIVHSDLYSPNILWLKDSQGNPTDQLCAIIDWQTTHSGNPCTDLCRLLVLNTSGEYRRANMPRLLEYYAKKVAQFMGGQAPFSMDQLRDAFKYAMPFAMMFLCYGLPFYYEMDSIVGNEQEKRKQNQRELLQRCRMFLEDTAREMAI